ncbi:MAG: c-type cytochrome [Gammaproteobacteria bacterium]|nr:c-type cytochrome [Gammaproteobacteria bacterium]
MSACGNDKSPESDTKSVTPVEDVSVTSTPSNEDTTDAGVAETPTETEVTSAIQTPEEVINNNIEEISATQADTVLVPDAEPVAQAAASSADQAETDNLALARKSGCLACHAVDKKMVGPAWNDVAKRYANNPDAKNLLIEKVTKGGRGNWTDIVGNAMMPPYSPRVSDENIDKLVDFILSLNP